MNHHKFSQEFQRLFRYVDWQLVSIVFILTAIGLIAVWSFSPTGSDFFLRQIIWVALGVGVFLLFSVLDYRIFRNHGAFLIVLYLVVIGSLAALLVFAPVTRGVKSWFRIGSAAFQPVEFTKLVLVLVLAKYFSRRHIEIARFQHLVISGLYVGVAVILVLVQPDLGSSLIIIVTWLAVVCFSGIKIKHLALFFLLGLVVAYLAWFHFLAPYQKLRIISFINPYHDPRGAGYNTIQAMIAAGSGKLWGKGIGYGTQSHLNFLPEAETDFIFAAFIEETGFIGAVIILSSFGYLLWRLILIGIRARDNFSKLFIIGFASMMYSEVFIHITINLGLLPVTGIGLPLISYGGSSLITTLAGLGIAESIRIHSAAEVG